MVSGRSRLARIVSRIGPTAPAFFVLALGLAISFAAWRFTELRVDAESAGEFQQKTSRAVETIDRRVQDSVNLLLGIKGLFSASEHVDRGDFQRYLSGFQLERRHAVIRVLTFSRYLTHAERPAFEKRLRGEVPADARFKPGPLIKPPGNRDDYVVIEYVEPVVGNEAAFGLDLAANPLRRAEILHARDSGEPEASSPLEVVINPNHISIALRIAVYRHGMPLQTLEQRRKAFLGLVGSVIRVDVES